MGNKSLPCPRLPPLEVGMLSSHSSSPDRIPKPSCHAASSEDNWGPGTIYSGNRAPRLWLGPPALVALGPAEPQQSQPRSALLGSTSKGGGGGPLQDGGVPAGLGTRPLQQPREVVLPHPFGDEAGEMLRPGAKESGESGLSEGPHDQSVYWEETGVAFSGEGGQQ